VPDRFNIYVAHLAALPGVRGAALVDQESGMVWARAGDLPEFDRLSEAAVEFWRIHRRVHAHIAVLGELHAISVQCDALTLKLQPTPEHLGERGLISVLVIDWHTAATSRKPSTDVAQK
jgi:hypothetical protein